MPTILRLLTMIIAIGLCNKASAKAQEQPLANTGQLWGYAGTKSPRFWGDLTPRFHVCRTGKMQSPLNIPAVVSENHIATPSFQYQPTSLRMVRLPYHLAVNMKDAGGLTMRGRYFRATVMTFRAKSEHSLGGKYFPLELQLHHVAKNGQRVVLAVMFMRGPENNLINNLLPFIPGITGNATATLDSLINPAEFFPELDTDIVSYMGSDTTPPCAEGVIWLISRQPLTASGRQLRILSRFFVGHSRPLQPVNGRLSSNLTYATPERLAPAN